MSDLFTGVFPYNGTSGWKGSDTSRERAVTQDKTGVTSKRQGAALALLAARGVAGLTWNELAELLELHHGAASGVLSVLHKTGHVARLSVRRGKSKVYVLPQFTAGRDTEPHGARRCCPHCGGDL